MPITLNTSKSRGNVSIPAVTSNSNAHPMTYYATTVTSPTVPASNPGTNTSGSSTPGNPNFSNTCSAIPYAVSSPQQIMGLVPVFNGQDCREGTYKADPYANSENFPIAVFASLSNSDPYQNDFNSWLFSYPGTYNPISSQDFQLQKQNANGTWTRIAYLTSSTYGTVYNYTSSGLNWFGFSIDWKKVLTLNDIGTYRFAVIGQYKQIQAYALYSPPFCLEAFGCVTTNSTVKFNTTNVGGTVGSVTDQGISWSLCSNNGPITWNDSIRFEGFFGYQTGEITRDMIKYSTGVINKIRDEVLKKFTMKTQSLPKWLLDRFMGYALMADQLYVSDYNQNNSDYNIKNLFIVADSNFAPKYTSLRDAKILDLQFKEGQQYIFRDRCCPIVSQ